MLCNMIPYYILCTIKLDYIVYYIIYDIIYCVILPPPPVPPDADPPLPSNKNLERHPEIDEICRSRGAVPRLAVGSLKTMQLLYSSYVNIHSQATLGL